MAKNQYPVALGQVLFTKTFIESISTFNDNSEAIIGITPSNGITVQKDSDSNQYVATMSCVLNEEKTDKSPYFIDVQCIGTFIVNKELIKDEDEAKRAVTIIAHNVLYGAIRETVAYITSRQAFGTFTLGLSVLTQPEKKVLTE
jgi:preprotein translocase subunit SecB